jgi:hypothetical protein
MQGKSHDKSKLSSKLPPVHPLKGLSTAEFAALGVHQVVFERQIDAAKLANLLPMAQIQSTADVFYLIVSADGSPLLVTDDHTAIEDWLDDADVSLAAVH